MIPSCDIYYLTLAACLDSDICNIFIDNYLVKFSV